MIIGGLYFAEKNGMISKSSFSFSSLLKSYQKVKIGHIFRNRQGFDQKSVSVNGYILNYKEKVSRRGNRYTVFQLYSNTGSITVHYRGHLGLSNNSRVCVKGDFIKEKRLRDLRFYNQLEADSAKRI